MPDLKKAGPGGSNLLGALQMAERLEAGATTSVADRALSRLHRSSGIQLVGPVGCDLTTLNVAQAIADLLCKRDLDAHGL
jgi:hypothetical protein